MSALPFLTTHRTDVGILVTTSGYGPASYESASGKPLELVDGSNLLHLLAEHAQARTRIDPSESD
ncbi:restriction endonuclease [Micromonospora sp. NPDC047670]|uniref:restriction endonuclease n=1 Tax=Micromonospora sp. NPDC047670 TaxID=3364252 RepID=UPI00371FA12E